MSENIVLQESSDTHVEETATTQAVEAPRSDETSQEMSTAEAIAQEEPAETPAESPTAEDTQAGVEAEPPADVSASEPIAKTEEPTETETASDDAVAASQKEPTAEPQAAPDAVREAEEHRKPKKRRRRRRRRSRAAALPPADVKVIPRKKIVKPLKRGMELEGTVRRLAEFGAFVDIGVGTDGLVHISELSPTRVKKVSDVVQEGQQVKVWIKDLNKEENRISLTMIPPGTKTIRNLEEGEIVRGTVTRLAPYGAFVDIGVGRDAMLHVREMAQGYVARPEDVVHVGEELEARVIAVDRRRQRIDLSLKGLRAEPDSMHSAGDATRTMSRAKSGPRRSQREPAYEESRNRDEDEIPSVMALAFQKALGDDFELPTRRNRRPKRRRRNRDDYDEEMEEVLSRTLRYRGDRM